MDSISKYRDQEELPSAAENPFPNGHSAGFNSLYSSNQEPSFGTHWDLDTFQDPQSQSAVYQHGESAWHQNPLHHSNPPQVPDYGVQSGNYGLPYARSTATFDFPTYNPRSGHPYSTSSYDPSLTYGHGHLVNPSNFGVPEIPEFARGNSQNGTVAPQALQSYPNSYGAAVGVHTEFQPQRPQDNGNLSPTKSSINHQPLDYSFGKTQMQTEAPTIPSGSVHGDFILNDIDQFATITNSTALHSFVFLGNKALDLDTTKSTIPRYLPRKSRNELRRFMHDANGDTSWGDARRSPFKKLKVAVPKSARSRELGFQGTSRSSSSFREEPFSESSSESEPEDDSDYESGSEEELDIEESSPLPAVRPAEPSKAVEFDIIKAVWAPRASPPTPAMIRTALGDYWTVVKAVRDVWKADSAALQQAADEKQLKKLPELKSKVLEQRKLMEAVLAKTLEHGHRDIIEKLGENASLILVFYQFIADRFKEGDYNGTLMIKILEVMTRCVTLDQVVLEKTKFDKVLPRLIKRGDSKVKELAQGILDNAAALAKKKAELINDNRDLPVKENVSSKSHAASKLPSDRVLGLKRAKEGDKNNALPQRKAAPPTIPGSRPSGATKTTGLFSKRHSVSTPETKSQVPASIPNVAKIKGNHVAAKPSGFFSSLQSASKKPGTSNAAVQAAQQQDAKASANTEKKSAVPTASMGSAPKPLFSFAETMANLTKPKQAEPAAKAEDNRPPETEEEKGKRLRKEERRKLRVSFKPDDSLTEIRLFTHDPEEEVGHEDSMMRDVDDIGGEGRMLKMHKDYDMMDEEEDGAAGEEILASWNPPSPVDFSLIEREERERNCSTRGGLVEVKSRERAMQEQRELSTLMVVYTSVADVPTSPREPSDPYSGEHSQELMFGPPDEKTKAREAQYHANQSSQQHPPHQTAAPVDIMALLNTLNGGQQQAPQPHPQPQAISQAPQTEIEKIFAQFSGGQRPPVAQPQMQQPPQVVPGFDLQNALAAFSQGNHGQIQPPPQAQVPHVQALLAQMGQQPSTQTQVYGYQNQFQGDYDRKRSRSGWGESDGQNNYDDRGGGDFSYGDNNSNKRQKAVKDRKKKIIPRVPCKFWNEGNCKKGSDCTYLHD
ncbi:MAG: hypothetical protein M1830_000085 [Pleopsidium flavum]|nr:MAG: hypothetical protein M1830_000085 [Pleopsidium flavum]